MFIVVLNYLSGSKSSYADDIVDEQPFPRSTATDSLKKSYTKNYILLLSR